MFGRSANENDAEQAPASHSDASGGVASEGDALVQKLIKDASDEIRLGFIRKVYVLVGLQFVVMSGICLGMNRIPLHWLQHNTWLLWTSLALYIVAACSVCCAAPFLRKFPFNYIYLTFFTIVTSVFLGTLCATLTWQSVALALGSTAVVFLVMSIIGACVDQLTFFIGCWPFMIILGLAVSVLGSAIFIMYLCGVAIMWVIILYDVIGLILACLYIIFDTQLVIGEYGGHAQFQFTVDDYAFAVLILYMDIFRVFVLLLSLMGQRK